MLLSEVTAPLRRMRVIECGSTGNNTVRHWRELKQIEGPLYMSEPKPDKWGYVSYNVYLIFPGVPDGVIYQNHMIRPEFSTSEELSAEIEENGLDTPAHFVGHLDRMMEANHFIGNILIEFVRQWAPERAEVYAKYREEYNAHREEKNLRLNQEHEEKRKAKQAAMEAAEKAARAEYLGWADKMTAMQFGRVSATMERLFRYDGVVMSRKQFVLSRVRDGWYPKKVENKTSWRRVHFEWVEGKPHTEYRLAKDNLYHLICKTEYDFACYLTEHGILEKTAAA